MSGDDSFPNFDWLKQGIGSQPPAPAPSEPAPLLPPEPAEVAEPAAAEDSGSAIDDLEQLPDPQLNESDGSTLIIRHDDFAADDSPASPSRQVTFTPGYEEFSAPAAEVPPLVETDFSEEEAAPLGPPSAESANESEAIEANPTDPVPVASTQRFPWDPDPVAAMSNPETAFIVGTVAGAADANQEQEAKETVLEESPATASGGEDGESHTEVLKSDEVPRPAPGSWPDFAMPVAAAATAASLLPPSDDAIPVKSKSKKPAAAATATTQGPSRMLVILASYASAMTLAFIALLVRDLSLTFRPHHLESLPDIVSEKVENLSYIPANATLPPGHTLVFGEARRFGNILVEPIKITQEPAAFVHYTGDAKKQKEPTAPVWKLWLKLTNVSDTQTIAPLDRRLVLRWVPKARQTWDYTNYYVTERDTTNRNAPSLQLYRLPSASDWDLKDQELGKELKPGESYITYLASTDEGFEALGQDLVWRVQIRKGYSNQGHGVTTIFQVAFKKDEVTKTAS
ncbi:hypothetical protein [Planctomicrobium piriforme]|uniref:Uncharacterized protein n=1 Tax=Planctomicrobium piriforme TaxID=1576369 RepID=A0A1I3JI48_9PLAN|nr:hypothetical protein [Planctomicrobium piriforme]SFI59952.1 hypothetical protein SAMN05421753_110184 [Planctomicrobium piriforme]